MNNYAYTITVAGPGGCIATEMQIIKNMLEAAGYEVTVVDDHPAPDQADLDRRSKLKPLGPVRLIANHVPWGG